MGSVNVGLAETCGWLSCGCVCTCVCVDCVKEVYNGVCGAAVNDLYVGLFVGVVLGRDGKVN